MVGLGRRKEVAQKNNSEEGRGHERGELGERGVSEGGKVKKNGVKRTERGER